MTAALSVLVVGAGAFGTSAALSLRARGHRVTLLDPGPLPRDAAASTDVSKVVRMDYGGDLQHTELAAQATLGWQRWNQQWGERLYRDDGFLVLSRRAMAPGSFEHDSFTTLSARGVPCVRLDADALRSRFPAFAHGGCVDGYFNPAAGWVASGAAMQRLVALAAANGVAIAAAACARLLEQGGRVVGAVTTTGETLRADVVLVAAGAWTPVLLPELSPMLAVTGQPVVHLQVDAAAWRAPAVPVWACDIATSGWYGFPALADGAFKIGRHGPGRAVHPDEPRTVTAAEIERCRAFVATMFPSLAAAPVLRTRLCLYCDSADGDFLIDWHRDRPGLVVASGDSGHGFKFAPVLGDLIADVIEQKQPPLGARYRWRSPRPGRRESARAE